MATTVRGFEGTERFEIKRRLGAGGMGVVYEAYDRERCQTVALKSLNRFDAQALLRFKNEFRALHDIDHPNLVSLYELCEDDGTWFFTMELIRGVDFLTYVRGAAPASVHADAESAASAQSDIWASDTINQRGPGLAVTYDEPRLRAALAQLACGISVLHGTNNVHRDIKPSNILVTQEGRVVLLDFGLVTPATKADQSIQNHVVGTAEYMAPEQAGSGDVGPSADWYSMGVVLYEALTTRLPHQGKTRIQMLINKQQLPAAPPRQWVADVPRDLDALCEMLLSPSPRDRPSASNILRQLGVDPEDPAVGAVSPTTSGGLTYSVPFVGRTEELTRLRAAFEDSKNNPVVAIVEGASGLGKSELVRHFIQGLEHEEPEAVVLAGRCYERDSVAYKAFDGLVDELSRYMIQLPKVAAAGLLPMQAGLLPRLFPVLQRVEQIAAAPRVEESGDPQEMRRQMFAALRELLARIARRAPLVLVIDDLQWTDRDSLTLLQELLGDAAAPRLLLIAAMRPVETAERARILASVRGLAQRRIDLGPFSFEHARELAATLLPGHDDDAIDAIAKEAGGYPLFIMELARYVGAADGDAKTRGISLDEALWQRISQLPGNHLAVLELLSVAGSPITQMIAAQAAEISQAELSKTATGLRIAYLVRTTGIRSDALIEPYHDRVRETVSNHLDDDRRRQCHARLALSLERAGAAKTSPQALVRHAQAAGDVAGAARHAEAAARQAVAATAFDRAVDFFLMALDLGDHGASKLRALRLDLAWALLNAGRGREAAEAFDAASDGAEAAIRRDCTRLAAEQLLISGHIEEGLKRVGTALSEIGEPLLETPKRALLAVLWRRLRLSLRGLGWKERPASEITGAERACLQVMGASALGLSMVDSIRGAAFNARFVQMALQVGDPAEVARALGTEATMASYQGKYKRAHSIVQAVNEIANDHPDAPYIVGWSLIAQGCYHYFRGGFLAGEELLKKALDQLSGVGGTAWERNNASMFVLFCLRYQGRLRALEAGVESLARDAKRRGDLYLEISVRRYGRRFGFLSRDLPQEAQADLDETTWPAPENVFHLQDWQRLEAHCEIALYANRSKAVMDVAREGFAGLARSMLLRIHTVRSPAAFLRGRLLLASSPSADDLRQVVKLARQLRREQEGYVTAWSHLLLAGVESQRGNQEATGEHLRAAIDISKEYSMAFHLAAAQRRLGQLVGGDGGASLVAESDAWMTDEGIVDPEKLCEIVAPGFRDRAR